MSFRAFVHQVGCVFCRTWWSCAVTRILLLRCTCCFRSQPLQYVEVFVKSLTVSTSRHSGHFMHALHLSCRSSFICWCSQTLPGYSLCDFACLHTAHCNVFAVLRCPSALFHHSGCHFCRYLKSRFVTPLSDPGHRCLDSVADVRQDSK